MTKLNSIIYNKLLLQAEEAKEQGMTKLAENIMEAIGTVPSEESIEYSYTQLQGEIHQDMWKLATRLIKYYNVKSADVSKIDEAILFLSSKITSELENSLGVDSTVVGPFEPKLPGESK